MGTCSLARRGTLSERRASLFGRMGGKGGVPSVGCAVVETLLGYQDLPCGSSAAAAMLCVWCSHELMANVALMSSI